MGSYRLIGMDLASGPDTCIEQSWASESLRAIRAAEAKRERRAEKRRQLAAAIYRNTARK